MLVNFKVWENLFLEISKIINAQVEIKKNPSFGNDTEFISGQISLHYNNGLIKFIQGANKVDYENCSPSFLNLEYSYSISYNLNITLNERDFFDELFSANRISIGNKDFDKKFSIGTNDTK
ncbi:MAG: hypothetical protein WC384_08145 [Prolixibacteraceae bacterium]|jgi:hypothetical protein